MHPLRAATDLGRTAERQLHQIEIAEATGIDFHFGAVSEIVERRLGEPHHVVARGEGGVLVDLTQVMRAEYP